MAGKDRLLFYMPIGEALTGLLLIFAQNLMSKLLLGAPASGVGIPTGHVAGVALIALAALSMKTGERLGMAVYSFAVMVVLMVQGIWGETAGPLLWPAVILHLVLGVLLVGKPGQPFWVRRT